MKSLMALALFAFAAFAQAEVCTSVIRDSRGYEWETFTRSSYSTQAACDQAQYDCNSALSYARSQGRYYDAQCVLQYPNDPYPNPYPNPYPPYPNPYPDPGPGRRDVMCQTDLVDYYGRIVRSFTGTGPNEPSACAHSDNFCKSELARHDSYGSRCVTRGVVNRPGPGPGPIPPRMKTESCTANRYDPAGMFIQSYLASATGPWDSDVRGVACRQAYNDCSRDLRGRQSCQLR